ncbi:glycoside hydrolase family 127 protein [Candidatus Harpocratesius sp.]
MVLTEIKVNQIEISDFFWNSVLHRNQEISIIHQWKMLELFGSIDNFRIVAGLKNKYGAGFRRGYFYTDSDVYKWAEAASWLILLNPNNFQLKGYLDELIEIINQAQEKDGYLFTYNQFHFPNQRWKNLSIEHELYCLGHLIEAGIAHHHVDSLSILFVCAQKSADLLVHDFLHSSFFETPGHPEIEFALLKLYEITQKHDYFDLAQKFIEFRGKNRFFGLKLLKENFNHIKREKRIKRQKKKFEKKNKNNNNKSLQNSQIKKLIQKDFGFMETMIPGEKRKFLMRSLHQFFSGIYFQENKPFRQRIHPEGHAVRFGYFQAAVTRYAQELDEKTILSNIIECWENMVKKYMYITGGLGSLPIVEGFAHAYELPNETAYCETCAAIASILWTWQLFLITKRPEMLDIIELQLYNAMLVGMGIEGDTFLYRNILESEGNVQRNHWFLTPCCPSNISRILGQLGKYCYTVEANNLFINQYIGNTAKVVLPLDNCESLGGKKVITISIQMIADIVQEGRIKLSFKIQKPTKFTILLRIPYWASDYNIEINGIIFQMNISENQPIYTKMQRLNSKSQIQSKWIPITRTWKQNNQISIHFPLFIRKLSSHPKVKSNRGKVALARGPLIYCSESVDNPQMKIGPLILNENSKIMFEYNRELLKGIPTLLTTDINGDQIRFIPYFAWANRAPSKMIVWIPQQQSHPLKEKP